MSQVVIDASYALACVMPDEQRPAGMRGVLGSELVAPFIWPLEVASAMRNGVRRRRFDLALARGLCSHLAALEVELVSPRVNDPLRHLELSTTHDLTPYDALYIDMALSRRCPMASHDARLVDAARGLGIEVLN
ncbi:Ribonuclease VapC [Rubrivivax sp. A210]|uniref:type II toxin-antitoxin system VapC family toxin n=1 Tax=Rubrivivax sp. A210 TaxID=2772301 RepID=UPI00191A9311|nr:type II toxin-antitoxin system VapC family toxin [Rubrivivax sp. A210]CAD5372207.1 Ribonuclease VapC [Rubrivivax sp. A210]